MRQEARGAWLAAFVLLCRLAGARHGAVSSAGSGRAGGPCAGAPASAADQSKVPHYFGPYPNWANSPLTHAGCDRRDHRRRHRRGGDGHDRRQRRRDRASRSRIPAAGYTPRRPVTSPAPGREPPPSAVVTASSAVTAVNVIDGGSGYTAPTVTFSGGGGVASTPASATR